MSKLQFIFDNPTKVKKGSSKVIKKKKKSSKRKNPMRVKYKAVNKKTKKVVKPSKGGTGVFPTLKEIKKQELAIASLKEAKRRTKARKKKSALAKKIKSQTGKLQLMKKAKKSGLSEVKNARASMRGSDYKFSTEEVYYPSSRKKKKKTKKKGSKVAKKKKKTTRKKKKYTKKKKKTAAPKKTVRRKKRKSTKKKRKSTKKIAAPKRKKYSKKRKAKKSTKSKKRKTLTLRKGQSIKIKANARKKKRMSKKYKKHIKKNPVGGKMPLQKLQNLIGYKWSEIGAFAIGGAFYASSNALLARFARPVHDMLAKIPVVGPAMPNFIMGIALNYLGQTVKTKALKEAFDTLGDGLIASSVVGMGVNAAQFVPMLQPAMPMKGVDYTPELMGDVEYFPMGEYRQRAGDFGGVDYTPEMSGVDFTPGTDTLTGMGSEYSDADFGQDSADYGLIPEGLS